MADNVNVNYEDERFTNVENAKQEALTDLEQTYGGMINESDKYFQSQIDASKQWADNQSQLQQAQTDFTIEQIEQQKAQAQKDYTKEQSGAYVDWQKQSSQHGVEAEKRAAAGLTGTGFSESSQVGVYNAYQNRVAAARESYNQAVLNYNNAIKDARLQNNAQLAEIAFQALQKQLELSLQGFQYKNTLILEQASKKTELDQIHYQRYQDVLQQINTENAMAEEIRQYNQNYALQVQQYNESIRQFNQEYDLRVKEYEEGIRQFNEEIERLKKKDAQEYQLEIQNLQIRQAQLAEEKRQFDLEMELQRQQLEDSAPKYTYVKGGTTANGSQAITYTDSKGSTTYVNDGGTGNQNKVGNAGGSYPIDWSSLTALGYRNISATQLNELVQKGVLVETLKNGKLTYSAPRTASGSAKQATVARA